MPKKQRIYVDYAATTPVDRRVLKAMQPYWSDVYGNPGSVHGFGQEAMAAVDQARETIAISLGARFEEIIFTGGATEANNLVMRGVVEVYRKERKKTPKVLISAIEHESVMEVAQSLDKEGKIELAILPVDGVGRVNMVRLKKELAGEVALVSIMYGNNETGTRQDIKHIAKQVKEVRGEGIYPVVHTDAVQTFLYEPLVVKDLGVDYATISSHKIYGPKGVAVLYARQLQTTGSVERQYGISPQTQGGGQELGIRSGTEPVALIAGLAQAVKLADKERVKEKRRLEKIKKDFLKELRAKRIKFQVNGPQNNDGLPHILNLTFPGILAETLLVALDMEGVAASAGAACSMRSLEPSKVLLAMGLKEKEARESIRFSFGKGFGEREVKKVVEILARAVLRLS